MLTVNRRHSIHKQFQATRDRQICRAWRVERHDKTGRQHRSARWVLAITGLRKPTCTGRMIKKCSLAVIGKVSAPASRIQDDIYLGEADRDAFEIPTKIQKETTELKCEVFDFNKYKNAGKLSVSDAGQAIPLGDYNFTIFGNQDNVEYIYTLLKPQVTLYCLVEEAVSPFGGIDFHKLHITGVGP